MFTEGSRSPINLRLILLKVLCAKPHQKLKIILYEIGQCMYFGYVMLLLSFSVIASISQSQGSNLSCYRLWPRLAMAGASRISLHHAIESSRVKD